MSRLRAVQEVFHGERGEVTEKARAECAGKVL